MLIRPDFDACNRATETGDAFVALLAQLDESHIPFSVLWELTHICNLDCVMCYNVRRKEMELHTSECLDVLHQLAEAGVLRLTFSGGEILTRPDFFEIATEARALGFALDLKTNGTLITPDYATRIAALHPVQVDISLLGATPETFDAISRRRGTLERMLAGVRRLMDLGVRVKLNTLLLDLNVHERGSMLDLALRLGVYYEQAFKVSPADDGSSVAASHQLSQRQMTEVMSADRTPFIHHCSAPSSRTCRVGLSSCVISPYGIVYPCVELRIPAGDLRRERFADIWAGGAIFQQLRLQHICANLYECSMCPINRFCEGRCAGLAWKDHGDLFGANLLACRQAGARYAERHPDRAIPLTPLLMRMEK